MIKGAKVALRHVRREDLEEVTRLCNDCTELVLMPDADLALVLLRNYSEPESDTRYRAHALLHRLAGMQAAGDDHRR